jgi:hypothetical protein
MLYLPDILLEATITHAELLLGSANSEAHEDTGLQLTPALRARVNEWEYLRLQFLISSFAHMPIIIDKVYPVNCLTLNFKTKESH